MPKTKAINLLPQEEFETSALGRVLRWAMGSFRIIVIVTEMIVMAAFLSRFWLDAENSNLTNSIKIASSQIQVQSEFEKEFRSIQTKLTIFKQLDSDAKISNGVNNLASKVPNGITLTNLTINETGADVKGTSQSENAIAQFISNIKNDDSVKKVALGEVNTSDETESEISFQIIIEY